MSSLLDQIDSPSALRELPAERLPEVAVALREEVISLVSKTGGHLAAGLGAVELAVVLHYVFDTPRDKLIWDVGHQGYPHKLLTGRRSLKEQLEARPELADELEELADVIGMLRELGQERRKKGESILSDDFLSPVDDDEEPDEDV